MKLSDLITNHENITLGDLGSKQCTCLLSLFDKAKIPLNISPETKLCQLTDLFKGLTDDQRNNALNLDIPDNVMSPAPQTTGIADSQVSLTKQAADLKSIIAAPRRENYGRIYIGALFCIIMAFTIITFVAAIVIVAIKKMEFPPTGLSCVLVISSGYIAWFYMGIINKERRDILTALVGNKLDSGMIGNIIDIIKRPRRPPEE